jgi:uncharacterized membrane protein YGL010W
MCLKAFFFTFTRTKIPNQMRSIQGWFDAYGESHQNPTNKGIHWICVPVIFFSIIVLLAALPFPFSNHPYLHWGTVALIGVLAFYLRLSIPLTVGMAFFGGLCLVGNHALHSGPWAPWAVALILFAAAWIGQFYGHKVEGAKPSFFEDLQFLLIGPAWLMGFIYKRFGIKF